MAKESKNKFVPGSEPSTLVYSFGATSVFVPLIAWLLNIKAKPNKELKNIEGPLLIIGNHPSYLDPIVTMRLTKGTKVNFVAGEFLFRNKVWGYLFKKAGMIPKRQFATDAVAVKGMMRVMKRKGILAIFPEATRFVDGKSITFDEGVARMAQKSGCAMYFTRSYGAYSTYPRWTESFIRRGEIRAEFGRFVSKEEIQSMTVEEIHQMMLDELNYNENDYLREHPMKFRNRKMAAGLQNVAYACPKCQKEFTMRYKGSNYIECCECGNKVVMQNNGLLGGMTADDVVFDDLHQYTDWEKSLTREQLKDPNFKLELPCKLLKPFDPINFAYAGDGVITVTAEKVVYRGTECDAQDGVPLKKGKPMWKYRNRSIEGKTRPLEVEFKIAEMKGMVAKFGKHVEIYDDDSNLYRFKLEQGQAAYKVQQIAFMCGKNSNV
ncbi:MAG: 1-acyl-sn-glycerol-3-phosphate acyltransferase [Clostridia bacterium]|nr:1-acyl-sn-glycerol-3-phosphate acyltransferase [Clostridia bacterium]